MPTTEHKNVEMQARRAISVACATAFLGLVWPAALALSDSIPKLRHPAIIDSAYFAFALWAGASLLMLQRSPFRAVQWAWSLAWILFAVHVGYAFHFAHGWNHTNAVMHVDASSGFGSGLFVSYGFTLLWLWDVLWMCLAPASYTRRPRLLGCAVHGFFVFITFNGTVVFGHGFMRWVCAGVFAVLLGMGIVKFYSTGNRLAQALR